MELLWASDHAVMIFMTQKEEGLPGLSSALRAFVFFSVFKMWGLLWKQQQSSNGCRHHLYWLRMTRNSACSETLCKMKDITMTWSTIITIIFTAHLICTQKNLVGSVFWSSNKRTYFTQWPWSRVGSRMSKRALISTHGLTNLAQHKSTIYHIQDID